MTPPLNPCQVNGQAKHNMLWEIHIKQHFCLYSLKSKTVRMSQFQPVKMQRESFHKKLFWALLLFTSMQSQEPSYCRNSPNQTLPQPACVCWAAPRETNQPQRHHQVHFYTLIVNRLHFARESLRAKINTWEKQLTACTPEARMAMERHRSSSLQSMKMTALITLID